MILTSEFVDSYGGREFSPADRQRFARALRLLDSNEQHPSLRIHQLIGKEHGTWSASASDELRITFERRADGKKVILRCSRHYQ
jgi:mRNA-degrading endonuclease YafQ of YafQ-DinJ toxin-antitoxin module